MLKKIAILLLFVIVCFKFSYGQNIAVNTTGAAASSTNMFEVTQSSTTNNTIGIFAGHSGAATNAYAIWAEATGATNKYALVVPDGKGYVGIGTTTPSSPLDISYNISTASMNARGAIIRSTFSGAGDGPGGIASQPTFTPSSNLSLAYGMIGVAIANPPAGITISNVNTGHFRFDTKAGSAGSVTTANVIQVAQPGISGVVPTNIYGVNIDNMGVAGMTNAYGLYVSAQSGATNNYGAAIIGGKVGIGTATPSEDFHVLINAASGNRTSALFENTASGTSAANSVLVRSGTSDLNLAACHSSYTAVPNHTNKAIVESNSNSGLVLNALGASSVMTFETGSSNTERMRIDVNGNVGIGTASPYGQLHINTAGQASFLMSDTRTAGNQVGRVVYDGGTTVTGGGWVFQKMSDAGVFTSNLVSIIQNTGNVGINTITPLSKLDVAGGAAFGSYGGVNAAPSNGLIISGSLGVGTNNPLQKLEVAGSAKIDNTIWAGGYYASGAGNINAYNMEVGGPTANSTGAQSAIFFHHHSVIAHQLRYNTGTFYLEAAGNGYGTNTTPVLNVGGATYLAVNGGNVGIGTTAPVTNARLAIKDGHLQSQQTTAPTIAAGAASSSAIFWPGNPTDVAGQVTVSTNGAAGIGATITFNKAYTTAPMVILTAQNAAAATDMAKVYVTSTTTTFVIRYTGVPVANDKTYNYAVIETQ